jgi:hypothetical protein
LTRQRGAPDAVRELADHVITRTERLLNYENCYGEGITEALEKAQDVHLAACESGTPDPETLAQRLATGALKAGGECSMMAPQNTPARSVRQGWPGAVSC